MPSPTDQMAARSDQSAFACVPIYLVDEYKEVIESYPGDEPSMADAFDYSDRLNAATKAIAEAAADDIS